MSANDLGAFPNSFRTSKGFNVEEIGETGAETEETRAKTEERLCAASTLEILKTRGKSIIEGTKLCEKLSTDQILRLAGLEFIQSSSKRKSDLVMLNNSNSNLFAKLSEEDSYSIQLVLNLLAAAEKVGEKQFRCAGILLKKYNALSLHKGSPVQRVVHYFSGALRKRIDRETGKCSTKASNKLLSLSVERLLASKDSTVLAFQRAVPFSFVSQLAGTQAILEQVAKKRKVHIIDLHIRTGRQYTMLMQALASRAEYPIKHLKITAVGTNCNGLIEETGRKLTSFAMTLNLPFSFNVVIVKDILYLTEDHFELVADEVVVVYSEYILMSMLGHPNRLESLMRVMQAIGPCIMIVTEVEDDETNRMSFETTFFIQGIKNVVAAEGEERTTRHVKIKVWRAFFKRFRMVEVEFSMSSLYRAKHMLSSFPCGNSCTLDIDGKCLIVGWKGMPTLSLSAWIFE